MAKAKKTLTKRQRSLVTAGIVLAALLLVVGVILVIPAADPLDGESSESSQKEEGIRILEMDPEAIKDITVENAFCEYTLELITGTYDNGEEYVNGKIKEMEGVVVPDTQSLNNLAYYAVDLFARQIITDDLSRKAEFGLDDPEVTVTYNFKDGSTDVLLLGAVDASAHGRYALYNDVIYLAYDAAIGLYAKDYASFVSAGITPEYNVEEDDFSYREIKFSGTYYPEEIVVSYDKEAFVQNEYVLSTSAYKLTCGDIVKKANMDTIEKRFVTIYNLVATEIAEVCPTEATIAKYGLDKPYIQIDFAIYNDDTRTEATEYLIKISEPKDGVCYAMNQYNDTIFVLSVDGVDAFGLTFSDLVNKMTLIPYITKVGEIEYNTPDGKYVFTLEHFTNDNDEADIVVECEGRRLITKYFRTLYTSTIGITGDDYLDLEDIPDIDTLGEPEVEVIIKYADGGRDDDVISMYKGPTLRYYVAYNGQIEFLSQSNKIDLMLKNIVKILNDEAPSF